MPTARWMERHLHTSPRHSHIPSHISWCEDNYSRVDAYTGVCAYVRCGKSGMRSLYYVFIRTSIWRIQQPTNKSLRLQREMYGRRTALDIPLSVALIRGWRPARISSTTRNLRHTKGHRIALIHQAQRKWMCWYFQSQLICMNVAVICKHIVSCRAHTHSLHISEH